MKKSFGLQIALGGQTLTSSGAGVAVMLVLKAMVTFLKNICLPSHACRGLIVVLMICIYERSEIYGKQELQLVPMKGLIPEGFYSNFSGQSNKKKNSLSLQMCIKVLL